MAHSVYERVIIGQILAGMTIEQLRSELERADKAAWSSVGSKHIVNMQHVNHVRNCLIIRG